MTELEHIETIGIGRERRLAPVFANRLLMHREFPAICHDLFCRKSFCHQFFCRNFFLPNSSL
jgi:hypothetical protein